MGGALKLIEMCCALFHVLVLFYSANQRQNDIFETFLLINLTTTITVAFVFGRFHSVHIKLMMVIVAKCSRHFAAEFVRCKCEWQPQQSCYYACTVLVTLQVLYASAYHVNAMTLHQCN